MRENQVETPAPFGPVFVALRGIGFGGRMRMVIDHCTIIIVDIIVNPHQVGFTDNREIVGMLGGVGGRIVFDDKGINAADGSAALVGIGHGDMGEHFRVGSAGNTYNKCFTCYHNNLASNSSSTVSRSRVQRSSLRYFQPPSARMTTILPCSRLDATRKAACKAAPQDGPAKIPS